MSGVPDVHSNFPRKWVIISYSFHIRDTIYDHHFNQIEELLQQWQGLLFYRFLVCPHCFLANELTPFHFLGEWHKASLNRLPEIVKIACPVARGAVRVHLKLLYPPKSKSLTILIVFATQTLIAISKEKLVSRTNPTFHRCSHPANPSV